MLKNNIILLIKLQLSLQISNNLNTVIKEISM